MELVTLILTIVATGLFLFRYFFFSNFDKFDKLGIIHMKPLPILGNMAPVLFRQYALADFLTKVYRMNKDADYVGFYDFGDPVILLKSRELIKNVTMKYFDHFVNHREFADVERDPLFGKSLFSLCGEQWRETRNLLTPAFTGTKIRAMFKLMSACGQNFGEHFATEITKGHNIINMKDAFRKYANDVLATCAFGISIDSMKHPTNDIYVLGRKATNLDEGTLSLKIFLLRSFPKISTLFNLRLVETKISAFFHNIIKETMETRDREGINRSDTIQLLMKSRGKKFENGRELTSMDMAAQAFLYFFAGFDTTSNVLCFFIYNIAIHNDVQRKLQKEIDDVLNATNGEPTYDDIHGMQYLNAVLCESMRMYPGASFFDRRCVKRFELPPAFPGANKITLEPGDSVWIPVYAIHRDEKYFSNPDKYDPERFMGDERKKIDSCTYFPFGLGPRKCIGYRLAVLEMKVVIFHFLSKCHLKPSPKTLVPLVFSKKTFAMASKGGFWFRVEPRNNVLR